MDSDLVTITIEHVRQDGWATADMPDIDAAVPVPAEVLADLRLPGDRPLPPSLRRWLAYDATVFAELGWYDNPAQPTFDGMSLSEAITFMYDDDGWTEAFVPFETLLPGRCLPLVGGSDSRRLLYLGTPDSAGEYPVLVVDIDDMPYVAVMYPGLDVYLADEAGTVELDFDTYTGLMDHPDYGPRMHEHARLTGLGVDGLEVADLWDDTPGG